MNVPVMCVPYKRSFLAVFVPWLKLTIWRQIQTISVLIHPRYPANPLCPKRYIKGHSGDGQIYQASVPESRWQISTSGLREPTTHPWRYETRDVVFMIWRLYQHMNAGEKTSWLPFIVLEFMAKLHLVEFSDFSLTAMSPNASLLENTMRYPLRGTPLVLRMTGTKQLTDVYETLYLNTWPSEQRIDVTGRLRNLGNTLILVVRTVQRTRRSFSKRNRT